MKINLSRTIRKYLQNNLSTLIYISIANFDVEYKSSLSFIRAAQNTIAIVLPPFSMPIVLPR